MFNKQAQSMLLRSFSNPILKYKPSTILLCFLFPSSFLDFFFLSFLFLSFPFLFVMSHTSHLPERSPTSIGILFLQSCLNICLSERRLVQPAATQYSPCARSEKRPRNEVSFRVPGNICFFALMGRKHDAEVEFTCCHSQKSAKVGFSKGFLSDLIGPDRVVDTSRGQPARHRWEDETMAISCKTMHLVVV